MLSWDSEQALPHGTSFFHTTPGELLPCQKGTWCRFPLCSLSTLTVSRSGYRE